MFIEVFISHTKLKRSHDPFERWNQTYCVQHFYVPEVTRPVHALYCILSSICWFLHNFNLIFVLFGNEEKVPLNCEMLIFTGITLYWSVMYCFYSVMLRHTKKPLFFLCLSIFIGRNPWLNLLSECIVWHFGTFLYFMTLYLVFLLCDYSFSRDI